MQRSRRHATFAIALAVASLLAAGCERAGAPPNVLLISIDSLSADRLGAYGNPRDVSPTLDRLAREGVVFERAYSPTSWTLPAHVTLLTGRLPHHHRTIGWRDTIRPSETLLQETFGRRGYETVGFYGGPLLHPYYGFGRGFDAYESCMSHQYDAEELMKRGLVESHADQTNPAIERAFTRWVGRRSGKPFFAFVHMWDVHYDYMPPEPYASMFDPDYDGPLDGRRITGPGFPDNASKRDVEHLLALYDGEIRYTDDTIGRMLAALDAAGVLRDTVVVVTADHGEEFREHGGKTHHRTVYTESVHVPLVVWGRGVPAGRRVAEPVSLADVAPTISGLAGTDPLPDPDGRSLVAALGGEPLAPRPVLSGMYVPGQEWRRTLAVRERDRSLVLWKKHDQWMRFDVARDPGERHATMLDDGPERAPLAAYDAEVVALLATRHDAAADFLAAVRGLAPASVASAAAGASGAPLDTAAGAPAAPGDTGAAPPAARPPDEVTNRLRSLGYVDE
jgi:arylsulfatase